jgi:hypothetical protein
MKTKSISKATTFTYTTFVASILFLISCGGCGSGKVKSSAIESTNDISTPNTDIKLEDQQYLFQDHPALSKLRLTSVPKSQVILEYKESTRHYMHMFDEDGKYLGLFDNKKWEEEDKVKALLEKYESDKEYIYLKHITDQNRSEIWIDIKNMGVPISKKEFNKMNYFGGTGLHISVPYHKYQYLYPPRASCLIGTRRLEFLEDFNTDMPFFLVHQTYLYDYAGNLKRVYNYDEIGEYLDMYDNCTKGISQYLNYPWDGDILKHYRYHDFENNTYLDFNPHDIFDVLKDYPVQYVIDLYFVDIKENQINMVYQVKENNNIFINIIIDVDQRIGYIKFFEFPESLRLEWQFMSMPDGSKINLNEFEAVPF